MNITPEEIADAIAEILETADGYGIVITDKRLAQSDSDSIRLIKSQADTEIYRGWEITWEAINDQTQEGSCDVFVEYSFGLKFFHLYLNDLSSEITSEISFKRAIFEANEALNRSTDLGLGDRVLHGFLKSSEPFKAGPIEGGSVNEYSHAGTFTLSVKVRNTY